MTSITVRTFPDKCHLKSKLVAEAIYTALPLMAENFYLTNIYGEIQHFSERTRVYAESDLNKN